MISRRHALLAALATTSAAALACGLPGSGDAKPTPRPRGRATAGGSEPRPHEIDFEGRPRSFFIQAPNPAPDAPVPLLMAIHGHKSGPEVMYKARGWGRTVDALGWYGLYPKTGEDVVTDHYGGDVAYLGHIRDLAVQKGRIDPGRCFVVGFSGGAYKTYQLAANASDRFSAFVTCAGKMGDTDGGYDRFDPHVSKPKPASILHVHGLKDTTVPLAGGKYGYGNQDRTALGIQAGLDLWISYLGATPADAPIAGVPSRCTVRQWAAPSGHRIALILDPELGHEYPHEWLNPVATAFLQAAPPRA